MPPKLGWIRDFADVRDYTPESPKVKAILPASTQPPAPIPEYVDLRPWMSPVMNQGELGSCTAHAGAAIMEYYQNRVFNHSVRASRLFLYKVTRNLAKQRGDTGAELRTTMQALVMIGAPPEEYYPYDVAKFDAEPTAFLYALADDYRATAYYRHDVAGVTPQQVIESLQQSLAKGLPSMFGTTVYKSFPGLGAKDDHSGQIPFPGAKDRVDGGHAMVIVGYDNPRKEFLVRNSWGDSWGNKGYGWLPYAYVTSGLATDFWTLLHAEFTDPKAFA